MKFLEKLKNKVAVATMQADKKMYFDSLARVIAPSSIEEFPRYIKINDETFARCIVAVFDYPPGKVKQDKIFENVDYF